MTWRLWRWERFNTMTVLCGLALETGKKKDRPTTGLL